MTVRFVLVAIDDEKPLGPQMLSALKVLSWETVRELTGNAYSLRWLRRLVESSEIPERQTVQVGRILARTQDGQPGEGDVMSGFEQLSRSNPALHQAWGFGPVPSPAPVKAAAAPEPQSRNFGPGATANTKSVLTSYALATQGDDGASLKQTLGA